MLTIVTNLLTRYRVLITVTGLLTKYHVLITAKNLTTRYRALITVTSLIHWTGNKSLSVLAISINLKLFKAREIQRMYDLKSCVKCMVVLTKREKRLGVLFMTKRKAGPEMTDETCLRSAFGKLLNA